MSQREPEVTSHRSGEQRGPNQRATMAQRSCRTGTAPRSRGNLGVAPSYKINRARFHSGDRRER